MGCLSGCTDREKLNQGTSEQRWDYINLSDFKSTSCWSPFSYGIVWFFFLVSIAVYFVDLYTAANLLFFDRWSSQVKPYIPFEYSRWIFAGCIFLSWIQLAYRWWKAIRAMRSGFITASYLDPLAVRVESVRIGKARGWRRFLVFAALTKGRKGSDYVALFTYFSFEAWTRIIFAEGPRQVINALTLYSVLQARLIPQGKNAPNDGHTAIIQFFINVKILANDNVQQATILFGMLYVLIIWVISAISLAVAFIMYITFLWHHIPSTDGSLARFCRRKIERRLHQIVKKKVDKAIAKEQDLRVKRIATGGTGASVGVPVADLKKQPTLPDLSSTASFPLGPPSRQATLPDLTPFGTRPASPFMDRPASPGPGGSRGPTLPDMGRPRGPTRQATQSSLNSNASYNSDAPLIGGAAAMGYNNGRDSPNSARYPGRDPSRSRTPGGGPPPRSYTGFSSASDRSPSAGPPGRRGPPRTNTGMSNMSGSDRSMTPGGSGRPPMPPPDRSFAPYGGSPRRTPGPSPGPNRGPTQEYEMRRAPGNARGPSPFGGGPQGDYFGRAAAPPGRSGAYSDGNSNSGMWDGYGARPAQPTPPSYRPNNVGPGPRPPPGNRWNSNSPPTYNPPKF